MKFLPLLLAAAPAVMGRACKVRHPHSSKVVDTPINTQDGVIAISTTALPQATVSSAPIVDIIDTPSNDEAEYEQPSAPQSSLVSSVVVDKPKPKPTSGSGSSSGDKKGLGGGAKTGSSTFYGGNLSGGNCMFTTYTLPAGILGTAFSGEVWNEGAQCGSCIEVTGPSGTITAMIVDKCPECSEGHLDLFPDAFKAVGGTDGIVDTSYKFVTCGITSPIILHNKTGTSKHWFSMQVVNHNEPVESLEVSTDGGSTWQATTRMDYNFFENPSGFGTDSVDVRVTSTTGKVITVKAVGVEPESEWEGDSNF